MLPKSRALFCLCVSKPNETRTGGCSKAGRGLFKETAPSPETHISSALKAWLPDGVSVTDSVGQITRQRVLEVRGCVAS